MDYAEMIKDPELVLGFEVLISDSDSAVVKRTVKVFTSVYHHTLRLVASGELPQETLLKAWPAVKKVVDALVSMTTEAATKDANDGVAVQLVRFVAAAVTAHLAFALEAYPAVQERGRDVVKAGLRALKAVATAAGVGGLAFGVAVRSLVAIAALRQDLLVPVTELVKRQLNSLPPTLFDHNVRSLHKALGRGLLRLLRRVDKPDLKRTLVEMLVSVGVPRKTLLVWAAPPDLSIRKRSPSPVSVLAPAVAPPKKARLDNDRAAESPPPQDNPQRPKDPRMQKQPPLPKTTAPPTSSVNSVFLSSANTVSSSSDLSFLSSLIPKATPSSTPAASTPKQSDSLETELLRCLDLQNASTLALRFVSLMPDSPPKGFAEAFRSLGPSVDTTSAMRTRTSKVLAEYFSESGIISLSTPYPPSPPSSPSDSTPSSTPPPFVSINDTDMRKTQPPTAPRGDVDMRMTDPRLATLVRARDPRLDIKARPRDPRLASTKSSHPRMELQSPESPPLPSEQRKDPRLLVPPPSCKERVDPRKRLEEASPASPPPPSPFPSNFNQRRSDPRQSRAPLLPQRAPCLPSHLQSSMISPAMSLAISDGRLHMAGHAQMPIMADATMPFGTQPYTFASMPNMPNPGQFGQHFMGGMAMQPPMVAPSWQMTSSGPNQANSNAMMMAQSLASVQSVMMNNPTALNL